MAMGKLRLFKARPRKARKLPKRQKNAVVKLIRKELKANTELKYRDVNITGNFDATAEIPTNGDTMIYGIQQGDSQQTREGSSIMIKSLSFKGVIALTDTAAALPAMQIRIAVVRYPKCDGRAIVLGDIWQQLVDIGVSHREFDYKDDYKVIGMIKKKIVVNSMTTDDSTGAILHTSGNSVPFSWSKSFRKGLKVTYDANAGATTDVESNNIAIVAQVVTNTNADDACSFLAGACYFRVTYTDL